MIRIVLLALLLILSGCIDSPSGRAVTGYGCTNDCSYQGERTCYENYVMQCGYYDADSCLDWKTFSPMCMYGCSSGYCMSICETPDLKAYYRFDDSLSDSSGNGNDAIGDISYGTGVNNKALFLDGQNYASVYPTFEIFIAQPPYLANPFSITALVKPISIGGQNQVIVGDEYGSSFAFGIDPAGRLFMNLDDETAYSSTQLENNTWYHVAVTYSGGLGGISNPSATSHVVSLYINGVRETGYPKQVYDSSFPQGMGDFVWGWTFGSENIFSYNYHGLIDELNLYCGVLSPDDIQNMYGQYSIPAPTCEANGWKCCDNGDGLHHVDYDFSCDSQECWDECVIIEQKNCTSSGWECCKIGQGVGTHHNSYDGNCSTTDECWDSCMGCIDLGWMCCPSGEGSGSTHAAYDHSCEVGNCWDQCTPRCTLSEHRCCEAGFGTRLANYDYSCIGDLTCWKYCVGDSTPPDISDNANVPRQPNRNTPNPPTRRNDDVFINTNDDVSPPPQQPPRRMHQPYVPVNNTLNETTNDIEQPSPGVFLLKVILKILKWFSGG